MAKFVMECPNCGKYVEAKTGFFARRRIDCSCGYTINVRTDKMTTRVCPHCNNTVMFDQSKKEKAKCPVCGEPINTMVEKNKMFEFSCSQCGVRLITSKAAQTYTCPVCDHVNDVQERLMAEEIREKGLASVIKYEGDNNTFIWKHPVEDFNMGSQLIVHESQEAIFFRDGQALDLFGPGRYTLETQKLPMLDQVYKLPADTETTFHSEVYFINKTVQMAIKWGTPEKVRFIDPLTSTPLEIGASGEMNVMVSNGRKLLLKLVGTTRGISWEDGPGFTKSLQASFRPLIANAVKTNLPAVIRNENIDLLEIDEKLDIISENLRQKINPGFEEYGLTIPQMYVTSVVLPENDPNFKRIRDLHTVSLQARVLQAEATVKTVQAQTETQYRTAQEQSRAAIEAARRDAELQRQITETEIARKEAERRVIAAQAEAQAMRMAGLTEAEVMAAKGYNQRDVLQADVQKAYAEGIGNMGPAISAGGGSNVMGEMLGLGVGLAAMNAVAPQIGGMFKEMNPNPVGVSGTAQPAAAPAADTWDCECGNRGITGNFCSNCGRPRPKPAEPDTWDCLCGNKGIRGNFCSNCGRPRPKPAEPETWDCVCGNKNIRGNFCNMCGRKRGE